MRAGNWWRCAYVCGREGRPSCRPVMRYFITSECLWAVNALSCGSPITANGIRHNLPALFTLTAWTRFAIETSYYFTFPTPLYSNLTLHNSKWKVHSVHMCTLFLCCTPSVSPAAGVEQPNSNYKHTMQKKKSLPQGRLHTSDNAPLLVQTTM